MQIRHESGLLIYVMGEAKEAGALYKKTLLTLLRTLLTAARFKFRIAVLLADNPQFRSYHQLRRQNVMFRKADHSDVLLLDFWTYRIAMR